MQAQAPIYSGRCVRAGAKRGILGLSGIEEDVGMIGLHWNHRFVQLVPWRGPVTWEVRVLLQDVC